MNVNKLHLDKVYLVIDHTWRNTYQTVPVKWTVSIDGKSSDYIFDKNKVAEITGMWNIEFMNTENASFPS